MIWLLWFLKSFENNLFFLWKVMDLIPQLCRAVYSIDYKYACLIWSGWLGFWLDGDTGLGWRIWKLSDREITAPDCDTICDMTRSWYDEELTEDVWWLGAGMFVPFLVTFVLLSGAVRPDTGVSLRQNVNYFQVPGMLSSVA